MDRATPTQAARPTQPRPDERWTEVTSLDGDGPYRALLPTGPLPHWFAPEEDNPGCDCGLTEAAVRLPDGELLCAAEASVRGVPHVRPVFPRDVMDAMVMDLHHALDIYGGLGWASDGRTVLVYRDADDEHPRAVGPDERDLYDLGLDEFWRECPA